METKNNKVFLEIIRRSLKFDFASYVDPVGSAGGLALWWNSDLAIDIEIATKNIVHTIISDKGNSLVWAASFVYGCPSRDGKSQVWDELRMLGKFEKLPWLCMGDFNEVLCSSDKRGGNIPSQRRLGTFRDMLNECGLVDLEFKGPKFTWRNNRSAENLIMERIDLAFANAKWREEFDQAMVFVDADVGSDHNPLILNTSFPLNRVGKPFRFESFWTTEESCKPVIEEAWAQIFCGLSYGKGRQIQDNIIVAYEVFHYLRHKKEGPKASVAIKLNLNKAYDRVCWDFLFQVMEKLGFDSVWIHWIKQCVCTVKYSVCVNGGQVCNVMPKRGLRQGDPLSPYLFLIVADVFSSLIQKAIQNKSLRGLQDLAFLDDSDLQSWLRFGVKCSYAEPNTKEDAYSSTIDVIADVKPERVVVLGGSGFVGSAICKAAVRASFLHRSMGRSGDVFYANWDEVLPGATAVVSTIGGFGSEEQMQRINGEANVVAVTAAKDYGIPKFIFISVHDYNLPSFLLSSGYFTGKRKAESEVLSKYPTSGVVLRPGFIYGKRRVDGFEIPLDLIGQPLERFLSATENFTKPLSSLPGSELFFAPPVSVDDVALAAINGVVDDDFFGVFTIEQIKEAATKVRV
ncbi:hypothetical protein RHSIM_Rhsim11G0021500 [Rhododendron simsii]|uniref:Reverse transcriptase domain-containing protein n=1 Tax=Rhododendron simsii TaxID=118357 RepID=A0A834LC44_RHOSS|nr:hypothetical protein RHSIM_Rhsim11G0021500 [Rhododendron simsii]